MKPASFEYSDPTRLEDALSLLRDFGPEAKVLAGGQSLVPLMNMRLARPKYLVDINKIAELDYIRADDGGLAIGALTRERSVERSSLVQARCPLLFEAVPLIAHPPIRNRGTIGGSLAHADPAAELPAVMVAIGAEIVAQGPAGERGIKAEDFFITYLTTALEPAEILKEIRIPPWPANTGWAFVELARRHGDMAIVGVAATLTLDAGVCRGARIVVTGSGGTPIRARQAEAVLAGQRPSDELFQQAGQKAGEEVEPDDDIHATADYRRHLAQVLTRRALLAALEKV